MGCSAHKDVKMTKNPALEYRGSAFPAISELKDLNLTKMKGYIPHITRGFVVCTMVFCYYYTML